MRRPRAKWRRPVWPRLQGLRPPRIPLAYLLFIALPLSIWQSPGADERATLVFVASLALLILVSATARSANLAWTRLYFATGAVMALFHTRLHGGEYANELAAIMLLFAPLATVLALWPASPPMPRFPCGLLAILFTGTLLATGSRGGFLALAIASSVALAIERRWRLLLFGLALIGALEASPLPSPRPIDWLLHGGKAQGLTLDSLFTGRPEIWRRSLHAVTDFSWTGIGIGSFSEIVPALYEPPGSRSLEDAHSLLLQTALDLGVGGFLAMVAIVWLALRRTWWTWRRAPPAQRAWPLGLFTSLLAFCGFNLTDAVALGSPGSLAFFILLGLIYALPQPRPARRRHWRIPLGGRGRLLLGVMFMFLGLPSIRDARVVNHAAVLAARAIVHDRDLLPAAHRALRTASRDNCRAGWLEGKVAHVWNRPQLRDAAWADLLDCSAAFVPMIAGEVPNHRRLAELAVETQPSCAPAHHWLGRIHLRSNARESAERLYRRSLELDPTHGPAWLELGHLLASEDPEAALVAFVEGCDHGDPGANACLAAGGTAEQLGDLELAIRCYRKSRLDRSRERATQLQNEIRSQESSAAPADREVL